MSLAHSRTTEGSSQSSPTSLASPEGGSIRPAMVQSNASPTDVTLPLTVLSVPGECLVTQQEGENPPQGWIFSPIPVASTGLDNTLPPPTPQYTPAILADMSLTREERILKYLAKADGAARSYWRRNFRDQNAFSVGDLISLARLALVKAVDRWEPSLGSLHTYITFRIVGEFKDESRRVDFMTRNGRRKLKAQTRILAEGGAVAPKDIIPEPSFTQVEKTPHRIAGKAFISPTPTPLAEAEEADETTVVRDAISALPYPHRDIIRHAYFGEFSNAEIASLTSLRVSLVAPLRKEAMGMLAEALQVLKDSRRSVRRSGSSRQAEVTRRSGESSESLLRTLDELEVTSLDVAVREGLLAPIEYEQLRAAPMAMRARYGL